MKGINQVLPKYIQAGANFEEKSLNRGINPSPVHADHVAKAFAFHKGGKLDNPKIENNYVPGTGSPWLAMKGK